MRWLWLFGTCPITVRHMLFIINVVTSFLDGCKEIVYLCAEMFLMHRNQRRRQHGCAVVLGGFSLNQVKWLICHFLFRKMYVHDYVSVSNRGMDVLTSTLPTPPPPERLDLIPDRHCMSLHRVPFSSPSLRFLGWTKRMALTHHCLIMLEFIRTLEPSSTGLPRGFCLTPHCYCTTTGTRATQVTPLIQPKALHFAVY